MTEKSSKLKAVLLLQAVIVIYSLSTVVAKFASGYEFLSLPFIGFYGLEILFLGIYALLWQQMIKRFELSVAYVNRATTLLWAMVWAALIFKEVVTIKNVLGVVIILIGIVVVNQDEQ
ncbi:MAG: transporter [Clostridia bacterium]|nr:EamA family transporter [Lachnospiraceae bacterium]NCC01953.1 transporter [Clostridia bacterium]NCD02764.1 transporter [Clostridia bacterium]